MSDVVLPIAVQAVVKAEHSHTKKPAAQYATLGMAERALDFLEREKLFTETDDDGKTETGKAGGGDTGSGGYIPRMTVKPHDDEPVHIIAAAEEAPVEIASEPVVFKVVSNPIIIPDAIAPRRVVKNYDVLPAFEVPSIPVTPVLEAAAPVAVAPLVDSPVVDTPVVALRDPIPESPIVSRHVAPEYTLMDAAVVAPIEALKTAIKAQLIIPAIIEEFERQGIDATPTSLPVVQLAEQVSNAVWEDVTPATQAIVAKQIMQDDHIFAAVMLPEVARTAEPIAVAKPVEPLIEKTERPVVESIEIAVIKDEIKSIFAATITAEPVVVERVAVDEQQSVATNVVTFKPVEKPVVTETPPAETVREYIAVPAVPTFETRAEIFEILKPVLPRQRFESKIRHVDAFLAGLKIKTRVTAILAKDAGKGEGMWYHRKPTKERPSLWMKPRTAAFTALQPTGRKR